MFADDKRDGKRLSKEAPVTIEICDTGEHFSGIMYNYSSGGMYFETDHPLQPGVEVRVAVRISTTSSNLDNFRAKVRWCEEISGAVVLYNYGVGLQYSFSSTRLKGNARLKIIKGGANRTDD